MLMLRGHYDSGRYFALVGTNLKVNLLASKTYSLGPVFNYRVGRDDVYNDRVDDMRFTPGANSFEVAPNFSLRAMQELFARVAAYPGLHLNCNAYRGIAMNDCVRNSRELAGHMCAC